MTPSYSQTTQVTMDNIALAAGLIKKARPAFGPIVDFYSKVFLAQEKSRQEISLEPVIIDPGLLELKFKNEMPLIDPSQFPIDPKVTHDLLSKLCFLAMDHAPKLAKSGEKLEKALDQLDLDQLFSAILESRTPLLEKIAAQVKIPVNDLMFFAFLAMAPSIQSGAVQLSSYLIKDPELKKGYCPICGSQPFSAYLNQDGKRFLICSTCAHEWGFRRMGCVYCDSTDTRLQHYFFTEEEKEYRVYLCDNCQNYLKVIDLRFLSRVFVPRLEQIATLHLDMKAREKGYNSAAGTFVGQT